MMFLRATINFCYSKKHSQNGKLVKKTIDHCFHNKFDIFFRQISTILFLLKSKFDGKNVEFSVKTVIDRVFTENSTSFPSNQRVFIFTKELISRKFSELDCVFHGYFSNFHTGISSKLISRKI